MLQNLGLLLVLISSLGPFLFAEGQEFGRYISVCTSIHYTLRDHLQ